MEAVQVPTQPIDRFGPLVGEERLDAAKQALAAASERLQGRVWWHVNSTARGGGVAEMLESLVGYARAAGIDTRWLVIAGTPDFFHVTKRLHHALHGSPGDGTPLGDEQRAIYEQVLRDNARELLGLVRAKDVVLLHDPQTAGLAPALAQAGAIVLWQCHIGADVENEQTRLGWAFLAPYLDAMRVTIFSRRTYVPPQLADESTLIIQPSIDPFSPKNEDLDEAVVRSILAHTGLVEGPAGETAPVFRRTDGTPGRVDRRADVIRVGPAPSWETPLVVQVSRWDPLKDPVGVLRGYAELVDGAAPGGAELMLAGPNVKAISDDPEGAATFNEVLAAWQELPEGVRSCIQLANLPMVDIEENAAIVNALQRHATIVVQKSLHEGFGLTVTEAMWKARPVIASAVGGIQDQIQDGVNGLLLHDPRDLTAFAGLIRRLLDDPAFAARLGANARQRVLDQYLNLRQLVQYAELIVQVTS